MRELIQTEKKNSLFTWGTSRRYNSYGDFLNKKFGGRVQKISIDGGFTCPNRDGTKGTGGCIFCDNRAFNPPYCDPGKSVTQQLKEGIAFFSKRYRKTRGYLVYFQAYSGTYSDISTLEKIYYEALVFPEVKGIIIGTRPDCIDSEKIELLQNLGEKYFVAVEYGIESCRDDTLQRINRGHTFSDSVKAVKMTAEANIHTTAHLIFGLPGEKPDEMLEEAEIISELPLNSVKFHQLQIIKGTVAERQYMENPGEFKIFTLDEYVEFIIAFLERLNPGIAIERFTAEVPGEMLAVRPWNNTPSEYITRMIEKRMEAQNTWQGRLYKLQKTERQNNYGIFS